MATTTRKRIRGNPIPLIIEDHPPEYNGYPFITLLQYRNQQFLTIVDNVNDKNVKAFVLDFCGPTRVDESQVIDVAADWYEKDKDNVPVSFAFSRLGLSNDVGKIYRSLNIEFVTRVIGPLPKFDMNEVHSVKRRRRKAVPPGIVVHKKFEFKVI